MTATRRVLFAGVGMCTLALTAVSVAWACTPGGYVTVNPTSGTAGATVNVSGSGFMAPSQEAQVGPVQIRWNSTGGPLLATAEGPSFSTHVVIPQNATARTYYIVGVQRAADGSIVRDGAVAFTVNEAGPSSRSRWRAGQEAAHAEATPDSSFESRPGTGGQSDGAPAGGAEPAPASTEAPAATAAPAPAPTAAPAGPVAHASPARSTTQTGNGGSSDGGPPSGPPGEDAGQPPAGPSDGAGELASQPVAVAEPAGSLPSISSDVWSGFASPSSAPAGPSLIGSPATNEAADTSGLRLGLALLALGSAGLLGGGFAALRTRRRTVA